MLIWIVHQLLLFVYLLIRFRKKITKNTQIPDYRIFGSKIQVYVLRIALQQQYYSLSDANNESRAIKVNQYCGRFYYFIYFIY